MTEPITFEIVVDQFAAEYAGCGSHQMMLTITSYNPKYDTLAADLRHAADLLDPPTTTQESEMTS